MTGLPISLAQIGNRTTTPSYSGQGIGKYLPKPQTPAQAVGYFALGLVLLAVIFGAVIWLKRRND